MAQSGKGLAAFALILGLLGAGAGGYYIVNELILNPDTVLPKARLYSTETPSISSGGTIKINFTNANFDTHNAYNYTTSEYVIPEAGIYEISAQVAMYSDDGDFFAIQVYNAMSLICMRATTASFNTNVFGVAIYDLFNATVGDKISIYIYSYNLGGFARAVFGGSDDTFFSIAKLP